VSMYTTFCAYCGKKMYTFAKNRRADLPTVYCSKPCEGQAKDEKRFQK
jgi:hypothetical protein